MQTLKWYRVKIQSQKANKQPSQNVKNILSTCSCGVLIKSASIWFYVGDECRERERERKRFSQSFTAEHNVPVIEACLPFTGISLAQRVAWGEAEWIICVISKGCCNSYKIMLFSPTGSFLHRPSESRPRKFSQRNKRGSESSVTRAVKAEGCQSHCSSWERSSNVNHALCASVPNNYGRN